MDNSFKENFELDPLLEPKSSRWAEFRDFIWETFKVAVISFLIILPVRYFIIQPFYVKGASMEPNFYDHEYLIVDELSYRFDGPQRGDIVVFKYPKDPSQYFIKRVIGLPGEKIKIADGQVYVAKVGEAYKQLAEPYLSSGVLTELPMRGYGEVELAGDQYFLLGDNRDQSLDSRIFGPVGRNLIVGKTWLRGWPFNRLTIFSSPDYNFSSQ